MVKRWFLVGAMLLLVSLLVVGCGIPQEEHDAVVAELDSAQAQVASLQSDLTEAESQIESLESDLAAAESDYDTLTEKVAKVKVYVEIIEKYVLTPYFDMTTEQFVDLMSLVDETGDAEVQETLMAYIDSGSEEDQFEWWFAVGDALWELLQQGITRTD